MQTNNARTNETKPRLSPFEFAPRSQSDCATVLTETSDKNRNTHAPPTPTSISHNMGNPIRHARARQQKQLQRGNQYQIRDLFQSLMNGNVHGVVLNPLRNHGMSPTCPAVRCCFRSSCLNRTTLTPSSNLSGAGDWTMCSPTLHSEMRSCGMKRTDGHQFSSRDTFFKEDLGTSWQEASIQNTDAPAQFSGWDAK